MSLQGVVLAAGFGTRLAPLSYLRAKPSLPFLHRPLVRHSLDMLRAVGVDRVLVNLHHLPETVKRAVGDDQAVVYREEKRILGTAGALRNLRDLIDAETLIVSNGKIYFEEDLAAALEQHRKSRSWATLVTIPYRPGGGYNPVFLDPDRRLAAFGEPAPHVPNQRPFVFSGIHILDRRVLDLIPDGFSDTVKDIYPLMLGQGKPIFGFVSRAFWCECSLPERYLRRSLQVLQRRGWSDLGPALAHPQCHSVISYEPVELEPECRLRDCIIWERSKIGKGCDLERVIVAGAEVPAGMQIKDAVVTPLIEIKTGRSTAVPLEVTNQCMIWPITPPALFNDV